MVDFKVIYYIGLVVFILLLGIFGWGWYSYNKPKTTTRFLNLKLLIPTLTIGVIGLVLAIVPIGMKVWEYDTDYVKTDPVFITILVLQFICLAAFLVLAYVFSFDFGIAIKNEQIYFFGQNISTNKIIALDQKKHVLKIVYEQGLKKMKKRLTILTPKAQLFVKEQLTDKVAANAKLNKVATNVLDKISESTSEPTKDKK